MNFTIEQNKVRLDGNETQILSGAIHYFRTLPEQWEDRLLKLKQCGFNTVETYLAWHLHEVREDRFDFSGRLDFARFIELAGRLGLLVMVRPGPYICSECDLGGLPGWLLGKDGLRLRCENKVFLKHVEKFFGEALPRLAPLQSSRGGPLIAMQIENEYGSYAADKKYLRSLERMIRANGIDIQLFTSDGDGELWLSGGTLPEIPATVNFRNHPLAAFKKLDAFDTGFANAHFAMELWTGKAWHWGIQPLHHADSAVAEDIREIMEDRASVNCYMFHGGTNFGFTSGANLSEGTYIPLLTSYEVDSFLDEGGNPTPKYFAVQKVMEQYRPGSTAAPAPSAAVEFPPVELTEYVSLVDSLDTLSKPIELPLPEPMEHLGQSFGFIQYSTTVNRRHSGKYIFRDMRDRAILLLDGQPFATVYRGDVNQAVYLTVPRDGARLDILIENMGRINFNTEMEYERKGMTGFEREGNVMQLTDWTIRPLPLDDLRTLKFGSLPEANSAPGFYKGTLSVEKPGDTFLVFPEGVRGYVWVNGFNLGRYWTIGPQRTLYLPSPLLKKGKNEVIVFELHGLRSVKLQFSASRILDPMTELCLS